MAIRYNDRGKIMQRLDRLLCAHRFTIEQIEQADADYVGFCIACGAERDGCEPDARKYECEECGKHMVYGAAEIAIMGLVK